MGRSTTWTRRATTTVAGVLGALVAFGPGLATAAPATEQTPDTQYVVRAVEGQLPSLHADLARLGTVVRQVRLIDADVVLLSAAEAAALKADRRVAGVTPDAAVSLASTSTSSAASGATESLAHVAELIGASALWAKGITGRGVDVALIDSGIAPVGGLTGARVVHGPDLSFDSQVPALRHLDGFGHGTHLAGIISGKAAGFSGMAPGARLVSVKVADARGNADVSQVIAAIDWVVENKDRNGLDIRVLNLAFGTDSRQAYRIDPLAFAAEQAWHAGIVVVVSAGNEGGSDGRLTNPAIDPYVLAVGAADTTKAVTRVAAFSSRGDGVRNPDLVAPGAHLASLRTPGSLADREFGDTGRTPDGLFRGSGTSQAAAVTSGAAALLLQARPELAPDQVKALLTGSTQRIPGYRKRAQGAGMIDVAAAAAAALPRSGQSFARSTGDGSLEASRGSVHVGSGKQALVGERDIFGNPVDTAALAALTAARAVWVGGLFNGQAWAGSGFTGQAWGAQTWGAVAWGGQSWNGQSWQGQAWLGQAWQGQSWNGQAWQGQAWSGQAWSGQAWSGQAWSGQAWS